MNIAAFVFCYLLCLQHQLRTLKAMLTSGFEVSVLRIRFKYPLPSFNPNPCPLEKNWSAFLLTPYLSAHDFTWQKIFNK